MGVITKLPKLFGILLNISGNRSDLTMKCTKPFGFARFAATLSQLEIGHVSPNDFSLAKFVLLTEVFLSK